MSRSLRSDRGSAPLRCVAVVLVLWCGCAPVDRDDDAHEPVQAFDDAGPDDGDAARDAARPQDSASGPVDVEPSDSDDVGDMHDALDEDAAALADAPDALLGVDADAGQNDSGGDIDGGLNRSCDPRGRVCGLFNPTWCDETGRLLCDIPGDLEPFFQTAAVLPSAVEIETDLTPGKAFGEGWGVVLEDFNLDGHLDLLTGGPRGAHLFVGDGAFGFAEVEGAFPLDGYIGGISAADWDADGDPDVLTAGDYRTLDEGRPLRWWRNDGDGTFTDISAQASNVRHERVAGMSWSDPDRDGDLDVFVTSWDVSLMYINDGAGTFEPLLPLESMGTQGLRPLQPVWFDADSDSDPDLLIGIDQGIPSSQPSLLFRNDGGLTFTDIGASVGFEHPADAMGITIADFDGDTRLDVMIANFGWLYPGQLFYLNRGARGFELRTEAWDAAISEEIAWGMRAFDYDLDGDEDVMVGVVRDAGEVAELTDGFWLGENVGDQFVDASLLVGGEPSETGFGLATGDIDRDGRIDVVFGTQDIWTVARVLRNQTPTPWSWLRVEVEDTLTANRHGVGATVYATIGDQVLVRPLLSTDSMYSQSERVAHFGLGDATVVDRVTVQWADGDRTEVRGPIERNTTLEVTR